MSGTEAQARAAARLAHDVGKHCARAARNLPVDGPVPQALVAMLVKDLFETDGERRASEVLAQRAPPLDGSSTASPVLERCRAALERVDALEHRVRAGEDEAVREAARIARVVESELRRLAATLGGEGGE